MAGADAAQDVLLRGLAGRAEQQLARRAARAAADDDDVGIEGVDDVGDADAQPLADDAQALQAGLLAALGGLDRAGAVGQPALGGQRVEPVVAGGQPLERARLREAAAVGRAVAEVGADDQVAELGGGAGRSAVDAAVDHHSLRLPRFRP